jgi:hypothetical protein
LLYKILTWKHTPFIGIGFMTGPLINHIGLCSEILFFIGAFLIVRSITYRIEIQEAKEDCG